MAPHTPLSKTKQQSQQPTLTNSPSYNLRAKKVQSPSNTNTMTTTLQGKQVITSDNSLDYTSTPIKKSSSGGNSDSQSLSQRLTGQKRTANDSQQADHQPAANRPANGTTARYHSNGALIEEHPDPAADPYQLLSPTSMSRAAQAAEAAGFTSPRAPKRSSTNYNLPPTQLSCFTPPAARPSYMRGVNTELIVRRRINTQLPFSRVANSQHSTSPNRDKADGTNLPPVRNNSNGVLPPNTPNTLRIRAAANSNTSASPARTSSITSSRQMFIAKRKLPTILESTDDTVIDSTANADVPDQNVDTSNTTAVPATTDKAAAMEDDDEEEEEEDIPLVMPANKQRKDNIELELNEILELASKKDYRGYSYTDSKASKLTLSAKLDRMRKFTKLDSIVSGSENAGDSLNNSATKARQQLVFSSPAVRKPKSRIIEPRAAAGSNGSSNDLGTIAEDELDDLTS